MEGFEWPVYSVLSAKELRFTRVRALSSHDSPSEAGKVAGPSHGHHVARPGDGGRRSPATLATSVPKRRPGPGVRGLQRVHCLPGGRWELPMGFY